MSKESYARGFCKAAEAAGVDPNELMKFAQATMVKQAGPRPEERKQMQRIANDPQTMKALTDPKTGKVPGSDWNPYVVQGIVTGGGILGGLAAAAAPTIAAAAASGSLISTRAAKGFPRMNRTLSRVSNAITRPGATDGAVSRLMERVDNVESEKRLVDMFNAGMRNHPETMDLNGYWRDFANGSRQFTLNKDIKELPDKRIIDLARRLWDAGSR